jgi:MYXO-CTERM domain-containing protein
MKRSALLGILLAPGLFAAAGAAGCSIAQQEETQAAPDKVVGAGDTSALLKSTLLLQGGCTAAKVGPKHLLVAARCVSGNEAFAAGKTLVFTSAASGKAPTPAVIAPPSDAGTRDAAASDAGSDAGPRDAGPRDAGGVTSSGEDRGVTIAEVKIHPSYVAKCKTDVCGFNKLESSDAPDLAVILLANDLDSVPSIPVDLDPVGQADPMLVVTGACAKLDAKPSGPLKTVKTIAVPARSVNHAGSAYETSPQLVTRLAASYVLTAGNGWQANAPGLCASDISAPLFRGTSAALAGVTSNYTTFEGGKLAVTVHYTRVDGASRLKIGDWLSDLGASTIHSCSETAGGCVKRAYDGGAPEDPAGEPTTQPGETDRGRRDAMAPDAGDASATDAGVTEPTEDLTTPREETLPGEEPSADYSGEEDYSDAAAPRKKKAPATGCSAAPGGPAPIGQLFLGLGIVLGAALVRRRRAP